MRLILLGPPGAGKGTQAELVAQRRGIPHVATGEILREHRREGTELGREAQSYMDAGELVPDELVNRMVMERLRRDDTALGFLLDGYPRNVAQAETLEQSLAEQGRQIDVVLRFVVPDSELIDRIAGRAGEEGRTDDSADVHHNRLRVYYDETAPLERFYAERGLLRDVDAVGAVEEVNQRVEDALAEFSPDVGR